MTYRDISYYEGIRAKARHEYKVHENKCEKIMQTLYIPLKSGPWLGPSSSYLVVLDVGWFTIQWHAQLCTVHVILKKLKMVDRTWIVEVQRKPAFILRHFIPSKPLLFQWLFNLPLVPQWIIHSFIVLGQVGWPYKLIFNENHPTSIPGIKEIILDLRVN